MRCSPSPPAPSVARSSTPPRARLRLPATLTDELTTLARTQDRRVDTVLHDAVADYLATHTTPENRPAPTAPGPGHDNFVSV